MDIGNILQVISVIALPLLLGITLHEAAHGWVANKLGDKTAFMLGRVTLNPLKHIDPLGTVILPLAMLILSHFTFAFGWAKPVPVTWQNLKKPKRDMALVGVAGPLMNFLMALGWALVAKFSHSLSASGVPLAEIAGKFFYLAGIFGININCILMILNLIPVPPLDGSRVVSAFLSPRMEMRYASIEPYGIWILLALLVFGFLGRILMPPVLYLVSAIRALFQV